jgi:hypothetical protein
VLNTIHISLGVGEKEIRRTYIPQRIAVQKRSVAGRALGMAAGALQVSLEHLVAIEVRIAERAVLDVERRGRGDGGHFCQNVDELVN